MDDDYQPPHPHRDWHVEPTTYAGARSHAEHALLGTAWFMSAFAGVMWLLGAMSGGPASELGGGPTVLAGMTWVLYGVAWRVRTGGR